MSLFQFEPYRLLTTGFIELTHQVLVILIFLNSNLLKHVFQRHVIHLFIAFIRGTLRYLLPILFLYFFTRISFHAINSYVD